METLHLNHWAVFVCALLNLFLGALWYSPLLFYKPWLKETGLKEEALAKINPAKLYSFSLVLAWLISYNLAFFLGDEKTDWAWGLTAGFLAGFGWATMIFILIAAFEQRSWRYMVINGGYITVYFSLIGLILGAWR
ncbi:MAG: DUF1761 domain-containing protein [Acidobacteria bacterium]|nr:DUF1761 domain-containing protein [Acidobacteriota bacterium]MCB9397813.1 DUF1761 domain-containing protein [Acidobacteriota bacterium]